MNAPTVSVAGQTGQIFEGEVPETLCFVPQDCISAHGDTLRVAEMNYVQSGWDVRNMRFSNALEGEHLFPDSSRPVNDLESEKVRVFLKRMKVIRAS